MISILSTFLKLIKVKYTESYLHKLAQTHPNKNNMLGLKQVLDVYGIETEGVKYDDKLLAELVFPCILHISGGFVVGKDLENDTITYIYEDTEVKKGVEDFCHIWTGHALLPTGDFSTAIEPNYASNRKAEVIKLTGKTLLWILPVFIWGMIFFSSLLNISFYSCIDTILEWIGLLLCYFLMEKQIFRKSNYGDKVCSAFHLNNCNDVLFATKAKIGILSWSEIGFGYFAARLICRIVIPEAQLTLALIGWISMLYGIWSLWQQLRVLHNFCMLCTLVQAVVWLIGIVDIYAILHGIYDFSSLIFNFILAGSIIVLSILFTHVVASYYNSEKERMDAVWKLNSFKADEDVFLVKLHQQEHYETSEEDSHVVFGNKDSKINITILSNPHCNPCAKMHKRVESLLESYGDKLCVQYIFTSFNEDLEESNRFLIASYLQLDTIMSQTIFQQWFDGEKDNAKDYISIIPVDVRVKETEEEMKRHRQWCKKTGITATPTILVNGYLLTDGYEIEDLPFLI